jgi:hypothetical protein
MFAWVVVNVRHGPLNEVARLILKPFSSSDVSVQRNTMVSSAIADAVNPVGAVGGQADLALPTFE